MPLKEIGAIVLVLVVILVFGRLWFHLVEGMLNAIKRLFTRRRNSSPWHPFPSQQEEEKDHR